MKFNHTNIYEDMDYRDHIAANDKEYVNDFLNVFSKPILGYVGKEIVNVTPVETYSFENKTYYMDYIIPVMGDYYLFIAAKHPGEEKDGEQPIREPQWDALRKYSAENNSTLLHYVNLITIRHFCKLAGKKTPSNPESSSVNDKDNKGRNSDNPVLLYDIFDFLSKVYYDQDLPYNELKEDIRNGLLNALNDLRNSSSAGDKKYDGEKDYWVLTYCCMYEYNWDDIADELKAYFNKPFSGPLPNIPEKEKRDIQTRISQWKARAIEHLTNLIIVSDKYYYLKSAILQHKINRKL